MFSYKRNFIRLTDKTVECIKSFHEHHLKANTIDSIKELYECDVVLRANGKLYFCQTIEEVDFEELTADETQLIVSN